jgi:predicted RNase H-like nuclease (RuvC/YqgF family)
MSVEFSNAYQEILLDNLMSIIKQNFVFQTQLKIAENVKNNYDELSKQLDSLKEENNSLRVQVSQVDGYKLRAESNNSAHEEKTRIQSALNDEMRKSALLKTNLEQKEVEILELKEKIKLLETPEPTPTPTLKPKSKAVIEKEPTSNEPLVLSKGKDGSMF